MPINKNALVRRQVLDHCLSSGQKYTLLQLMEKCNHRLEQDGHRIVTSENTIRTDLEEIQSQFPQGEIATIRVGRNIYYRYKDQNFSIYKVPLSNNEVLGLTQALALLGRFDGMPGSEWLNDLIERFKPSLNIDTSVGNIVGFDENPDLVGREHFAPLLQAIVNKQTLLIRYRSFRSDEEQSIIIHPYYLKEYNNRWFLFALNDECKLLANYAFDRILEITPIPKKYIPNTEIDFFEYFDEMVGVSRHIDDRPQEVLLFVENDTLPYILTKPLHGSQRIVEKRDNGAIIQINLIINFELEQLVLSFCDRIKVLSPKSLGNKIESRIVNAMKKYQYAQ